MISGAACKALLLATLCREISSMKTSLIRELCRNFSTTYNASIIRGFECFSTIVSTHLSCGESSSRVVTASDRSRSHRFQFGTTNKNMKRNLKEGEQSQIKCGSNLEVN